MCSTFAHHRSCTVCSVPPQPDRTQHRDGGRKGTPPSRNHTEGRNGSTTRQNFGKSRSFVELRYQLHARFRFVPQNALREYARSRYGLERPHGALKRKGASDFSEAPQQGVLQHRGFSGTYVRWRPSRRSLRRRRTRPRSSGMRHRRSEEERTSHRRTRASCRQS